MPDPTYPSVTVTPSPGICIKTKTEAGAKFFINLCRLEDVPPPPPMEESELERLISDEDYSNLWRVPMSLGAPRTVKDKSGAECQAAEVALNTTWFLTMVDSPAFTAFVVTVAMEGLSDKYSEEVRLDRQNWTVLKNKKMMGEDSVPAHRIQQRASAGIQAMETKSKKSKDLKTPLVTPIQEIEEISSITSAPSAEKKSPVLKMEATRGQVEVEPKYLITREPVTGLASIIRVEVDLPGVRGGRELSLDLGEDRLVLAATRLGYLLDIFLPFRMDNENCRAEFRGKQQQLLLTIPLVGN